MKAVLMSIQPKWCELISRREKTVEVRKTRPKLDTPFKVYIYMTKSNLTGNRRAYKDRMAGKVIGEFVCDAIFPISILYSNPNDRLALREFPFTCLTDKQIMDYLGNGGEGYGWHISDLVIYDKPKELSGFVRICPEWEKEEISDKCLNCEHRFINRADYFVCCDCEGELPIRRPPQSWCYIEDGVQYSANVL